MSQFFKNRMHNKIESIVVKNGAYLYLPHFFSLAESDDFLKKLKQKVLWRQEYIKMYGKEIALPRLTAWYGDENIIYSYSGITHHPNPWIRELLEIRKEVNSLADIHFNSVLLNRYRNGRDSISWHSDAEKELGKNPVIASVNFGGTRKFQLRHNETKEKIEIPLKHGSVLIMLGELQHYWQHRVPKTQKEVGERINLTFRSLQY